MHTVLGDVPIEELGRTLTHEHLSMTFPFLVDQPEPGPKLPWTLENAHWIRQHPYSHNDNLLLDRKSSFQAIVDSVRRFKSLGGGCLVENSTIGLNRNLRDLQDISMATGVHVVAGTGFYVAECQAPETLLKTTEELHNVMLKEIVDGHPGGINDLPVKCGFIGEIGCSYPLLDFEKRAIEAAASVQKITQKAVSFHPGRHPDAPMEIVRLFLEAGGNPQKTIMSHLERTIRDPKQLLELAETGIYCQFDLFGIETSYYQLAEEIDFPSDAQRMDMIKGLVDQGFGGKILIAHDIHTKHRLEQFGGHGFAHILESVVPKMRTQKHFTAEVLDRILVGNPARVLSDA
eukprot:maker-scaffold1303_size49631-snap-gene-0.17 protein:Tk11940 transcript:maker-scaffold1303_size49631-snap-gene-0.17-mRNA-1 annotation:"phosphotriesterase-like protein"